jgi:hypothetical protein
MDSISGGTDVPGAEEHAESGAVSIAGIGFVEIRRSPDDRRCRGRFERVSTAGNVASSTRIRWSGGHSASDRCCRPARCSGEKDVHGSVGNEGPFAASQLD